MSGQQNTMTFQLAERNVIGDNQKGKGPGWREIIVSSIWLTLPLTVLTAALIAFVFKHQVTSRNDSSLGLGQVQPLVPDDGAIYVRVDSTMLVFLASWMSSVAPFLTTFAIGLATFPITQQLLNDTQAAGLANDLPTPFQLHLMLKVINGATWSGLCGLLNYRLSWRQRVDSRVPAFNSLIYVTLCTVLLSAVIFAADTWLHMATTTVGLVVTHAFPTNEALYGFSSLSACTKCNNSFAALKATDTSCTLNSAYDLPVYDDPVTTTLTLNDRSPSISVVQISSNNLSYLATSFTVQNSSHDFKASTYAVRTTCSPTSQACHLANNGNVTFNCNNGSFNAVGDQMKLQGFAIQVYKYSNLSDYEDWMQEDGVPNPFYVAGATIDALVPNSTLAADAEVVATDSTVSAVFQCQVTILDLVYTSIAGNISVVSETNSNGSVTNMFVSGIAATQFGQDVMKTRMGLAAFVATDAQDFADRFGTELNNVVLSSGAGSIQPTAAETAQSREDILVARLPKAPFYLLIAANLALVLLGASLTIVASATRADARQAQYHLTTAGLVATMFDRDNARSQVDAVEQLFTEYNAPHSPVKIGIDRTSKGGFELTQLYLAQ